MIESLQLAQREERYPVEFVIDCTGFKSLIWSRMGAEPFISVGDRLLNDRAIPLQLMHRDPTKIEPCTRATALAAGWVWRVPLYSRLGVGYVYSSAFRNDDEAWTEFLCHLRATGDLPVDAPEPERRVIKMRVGYTRQPWIKNCVAIGLSNGFVEPLEASAIYTIDAVAHRLVTNFPDRDCSPALAKSYNAFSTVLIEQIVDYLQTNYIMSNRTEPYWVAAWEETPRSNWLRDKLELWRVRFPDRDDTFSNLLFGHNQYIYLLFSSGYLAKVRFPLEERIRHEHWQNYGRALKAHTAQLLKTLPSHYDLLTSIREQRSAASLDPRLSPLAAAGRGI